MDEEIKEFKAHNGNVIYNIKDLLGAMHTKIDKMADENKASHKQIYERLLKGDKELTRLGTWRTAHSLLLLGICSVLGYVIFG